MLCLPCFPKTTVKRDHAHSQDTIHTCMGRHTPYSPQVLNTHRQICTYHIHTPLTCTHTGAHTCHITYTLALLGEARTRVILKGKPEGFVVFRGTWPTADDFSWACIPGSSLAFVNGVSEQSATRGAHRQAQLREFAVLSLQPNISL